MFIEHPLGPVAARASPNRNTNRTPKHEDLPCWAWGACGAFHAVNRGWRPEFWAHSGESEPQLLEMFCSLDLERLDKIHYLILNFISLNVLVRHRLQQCLSTATVRWVDQPAIRLQLVNQRCRTAMSISNFGPKVPLARCRTATGDMIVPRVQRVPRNHPRMETGDVQWMVVRMVWPSWVAHAPIVSHDHQVGFFVARILWVSLLNMVPHIAVKRLLTFVGREKHLTLAN